MSRCVQIGISPERERKKTTEKTSPPSPSPPPLRDALIDTYRSLDTYQFAMRGRDKAATRAPVLKTFLYLFLFFLYTLSFLSPPVPCPLCTLSFSLSPSLSLSSLPLSRTPGPKNAFSKQVRLGELITFLFPPLFPCKQKTDFEQGGLGVPKRADEIRRLPGQELNPVSGMS